VGGAAQTTASLGANVNFGKVRAGIDYYYIDRLYADWAFGTPTMGGETTYNKPWEMPAYSLVDVNASYTFDLAGFETTLYANVNNLFNQEYISSAYDGANHDWQTAYRVFYGFGRTYSVRLKLNF
jgi:outer membrane receptor protein involved in Fe transport